MHARTWGAAAHMVIHLVKLIDEADAAVCEDEGAPLEGPLARHGVLGDGRGQADCTRTLAGCVHRPRRRLLDVLQKLRLGRPGVADEQDVDVAPATAATAA